MNQEGKKLLQKKNVVGFGQGYKTINGQKSNIEATTVFVEKKVPKDELKPRDVVPATAFGMPTDVVETGEIIAFSGVNTDRVRPLVPGYSIGHYKITAGTFGAVVYRDGEELILSNNHVLANCGDAKIGDAVLQPGRYDQGTETVARLYGFKDINVMGATCKIAKVVGDVLNCLASLVGSSHKFKVYNDGIGPTNKVDAALAKPIDGVCMTTDIKDIGTPCDVVDASLGMDVQKTGRTTGHTHGKVTQKHATVRVGYPDGSAIFEGQLIISPEEKGRPFSQPGDSGSLILNERHPVGLLFAGSDRITIANPIMTVMDILGVTF